MIVLLALVVALGVLNLSKQTSVSFNLDDKKLWSDLVVAGLVTGSFSDFVKGAFRDKVESVRIEHLNNGGVSL